MQPLIIHTIAALLISIIGTAYLVPKIIAIVRFKKLMDKPNERSSHKEATPSLGGMAFFIILILSFYFNYPYDSYNTTVSMFPALTVLFFLGLKDDLVVLAPTTKLIGQIAASLFILMNTTFEINTFHGLFGVEAIPQWIGVSIGLFLMLAVINAFNLIDGIDGLAASVGIVAFSGFAAVFFFAERFFFGLTAVVMVGILTGFLFFNLSRKNKIFMGDTGSMIIGFMLAVMSVRFLALDTISLNKLPFNAIDIPIVLVAFLIIPLFDTARVFSLRLMRGRNPFSPDRTHLHHVLVDAYRISHRRASFSIAIVHIVFVAIISLIMKTTNSYITLAVTGLFIVAASVYLFKLRQAITSRNIRRALARKNRRSMKLHHIKPVQAVERYSQEEYQS